MREDDFPALVMTAPHHMEATAKSRPFLTMTTPDISVLDGSVASRSEMY